MLGIFLSSHIFLLCSFSFSWKTLIVVSLMVALVIRSLKHSSNNNNNDDNYKSNNYKLLHVHHVLKTVLSALNELSLLIFTNNVSDTIIITILQIGKLSVRLSKMLKGTQLDRKPF